ncbi:hypothetical protein ACT453_47170, partial [Bacillus sp. D-CC]
MTQPRKFVPHDYQHLIINHILDNERCAVFAGMGTGKTSSTLTALEILELFEPGPTLVVAPLRVATTYHLHKSPNAYAHGVKHL